MWRFNPFTSTIDYYEPAGSVEAHDLGGGDHIADTLENLNSKVSDGTLIDTGDARLSDERDPTAHGSEHTDGTDDIQSATNAQKGVATAVHITAIEANTGKDTNANHSGEVTGSGALTITNKAVTLLKMNDMATASLLGRNTAETGVPEVLSKATALSLLNVEDGADVSADMVVDGGSW